ncbi:MAG: hypothetical protein V2I27_00570 [Erythrobacter sp.]|jgi:hypothetical protein|nr:hypothetical protein [Erythrobacter sp.]
MTRLRTTGFEAELEGRLAILAQGDGCDRRLPKADTIALAVITAGCFAVVLIAQAL